MAAIGTAYALLDTSFKAYQARVAEKYGAEEELNIRYGIQTIVEEEVVVDEKGKEKTVTKEVTTINPNAQSVYGRYFEESNEYFQTERGFNKQFILGVQNYFNDLLKVRARTNPNGRGYVFLNEVYERLGFQGTEAGHVVGWIYDTKDPQHQGDNYIDFGIFELTGPKMNFVNLDEKTILLDFNVDGNIWLKAYEIDTKNKRLGVKDNQ
jgi:hypothetical protein